MRATRWLGAVGAAVLLGGGTVPASAAEGGGRSDGEWVAHFREDGFTLGGTDACTAAEDGTKDECLPPGASQVVLPDGRVLYWSAIEGSWRVQYAVVPEAGSDFVNAQSRLLTLDGLAPSWQTPVNPDGDDGVGYDAEPPLVPGTTTDAGAPSDSSLFCSDQALLPDGTVLAFGGTDYYFEPKLTEEYGVSELEGTKTVKAFDPRTNTWSSKAPLHYGRWYPSKVTLADGRILVASGVTKLIKPVYPDRPEDSGTNVKQVELYDSAGAGSSVVLGPTADKSLPLYPRLHLLPNGQVYYGASGQAFNPSGQSYDEALWNFASVFDAAKQTWTDLGLPGAELGDPRQAGFRGSTFQQMLPLKAPYTSATFLTAGGVMGTTPGSYVPTEKSRLDTVDVSGDAPVLTSKAAGDLNEARWYGTGVTLPTGQVLVVSGADVDHVVGPGSEEAILTPELYDPETETWTRLEGTSVERTYHNNAVLLPDGRVLVGGHDPIPAGYGAQGTLPGVPGVRQPANNTRDASFQIFEPPYFEHAGQRPAITGEVQQDLVLGDELTIPTHDAADIESVVLVRNTAQTHLIDGDQRAVELTIVDRKPGKRITAQVPSNGAVLPPGPYMLFITKRVSGDLVPSVARQVTVGATGVRVAAAAALSAAPALTATRAAAGRPGDTSAAPAVTVGEAKAPAVIDGRPIGARRSPESSPVAPAAVVALGALVTVVAFARRRLVASSSSPYRS